MDEPKPDVKSIRRHWKVLCQDIGERVAGSAKERRALRYVAGEFEKLGLANVQLEPFEFDNCAFGDFGGQATVRGRKRKLMVRPCEYSTSTPKGGVEGDLIFLDHACRADYGGPELQGKIGMFMGAPMPNPEWIECMTNSGLAAAILIDHRYYTRWPMLLGFPEMWASRVTMPIFSIPYEQAWKLVQAGKGVRVKLWVKARRMRSKSGNAIGDLPGVDSKLKKELIYVSGHVDTVRGSVGGSDNASGTVQAMELARMLRQTPLKRTVRFVGYGVEERLSVGSYRHYQNRSKNGMARAVFGYNGDSCSTVMGWNKLHISGPPALTRLAKKVGADLGYPAEYVEAISPYSDQFPLNMLDVPTIWVYRPCMVSGNWFFHSQYDRLNVVSADVMANQVRFASELLRRIGNADKLPFPKALPNRIRKEVEDAVRQFHGIEISLRKKAK